MTVLTSKTLFNLWFIRTRVVTRAKDELSGICLSDEWQVTRRTLRRCTVWRRRRRKKVKTSRRTRVCFITYSLKILPTATFFTRRSVTVGFSPHFLLLLSETIFVRFLFLRWSVGGTIARKRFTIVRGRQRASRVKADSGMVVPCRFPHVNHSICERDNWQILR